MSDSTDVHLHEKAQLIRLSRVIEPSQKKNTKKNENERQIAICRKEYICFNTASLNGSGLS